MPEDYVFQRAGADGTPTDVRLSELFAPGKDSLVIYSMMFPRYSSDERPGTEGGQTALLPLTEGPCPSCTAFLDQLDGAAEHDTQRVNFVVVAKSHCSASSPSPRSAAGGDCGSCPRPATATTGTALARSRTETKCRCGTYSTATARRCATSGARSSSTRPPAQGRVPATTAPSSRSGTFSTSLPRDVRPTGTRMSFMIASRNLATERRANNESSSSSVPRRMACCSQGASGQGKGTHPAARRAYPRAPQAADDEDRQGVPLRRSGWRGQPR